MMPVRFTPETCRSADSHARTPRSGTGAPDQGARPVHARHAHRRDSFAALVRAIVFQQLSTGAATTIYTRVLATMNATACPPPATWLCTPEDRCARPV